MSRIASFTIKLKYISKTNIRDTLKLVYTLTKVPLSAVVPSSRYVLRLLGTCNKSLIISLYTSYMDSDTVGLCLRTLLSAKNFSEIVWK